MEQITITRANGEEYKIPEADPRSKIVSGEWKRVLLGEEIITMEIKSVGYINFQIGDWLFEFGEKFTLNTLGEPERIGENLFKYNLVFEGVKYDLTKVIFRSADWTGFNPTSEFPLTGTAESFLTVLQYNLQRAFGQGVWSIGTIPATEAKTLSFNSENCLLVLNRICEEFGTEYEIENIEGANVIHLKEIGSAQPYNFEYGRGKGLYSLARNNVDSKNIVTRLYAEGSNKNIKVGYRENATRLQMPVGAYIESNRVSSFGVLEGSKIFDDVFPHRTGTVSALGTDIFTFSDSGMFDLNETDTEGNTKWLIPGQSAKIHFNTGNLAGYEFEVTSYDHGTKTFTIKQFEDERGQKFPDENTAAFQINGGDQYVILDIIMPDSYVTAAENELQAKAETYLSQNDKPRVEYDLGIDRFYLKETFGEGGVLPLILKPGDYVHVKDGKIGIDDQIRVKEAVIDIKDPYTYQLVLSNTIDPTRIERIIADNIEAKKALQQNRMFDPARTRRNWRDVEEVTSMLDTLKAEVALIGSPAGQFQLTSFLQANKNGNENRFVATAGQLIHDSYQEPGTWEMASFDVTLTETSAYYLYAKCSRTSNVGLFLLSLTKIEVEDDPGYYHFPVGVLSSVNDNARTLTTTYGYTLISGNNISTGIIQNDASGIMINLETGEIRGAFTFSNGQLIEDAVNSKSERHLGGTDPADGWTTIEERRKHVDDVWAKTTADGIEEYFYVETETDVFSWVLNETIIDGGRIKTGTIDAEKIDVTSLFSQEITANKFNLGHGSIGIFEVDSGMIRSIDDQGRGIYITPGDFNPNLGENGGEEPAQIRIEEKAQGSGLSYTVMRAGSLTSQAEIDGQSSSTYETNVISQPHTFSFNSNELRAGQNLTLYFGKQP